MKEPHLCCRSAGFAKTSDKTSMALCSPFCASVASFVDVSYPFFSSALFASSSAIDAVSCATSAFPSSMSLPSPAMSDVSKSRSAVFFSTFSDRFSRISLFCFSMASQCCFSSSSAEASAVSLF